MSTVYKQTNLKANVSLERGTPNVPNDGKYHLIVEGQVVNSFKALKHAKDAYEKELGQRNITTHISEITMTETAKKALLKDMNCNSYQADASSAIKVPKRSGARRYG
jgi:hypothetical protein